MSFGSRLPNRMTPSGARAEPTRMARPRMSSAFEKSAPRSDVLATTISPAPEREQHDRDLRNVPERRLQDARRSGPDALAERLGRERDRPCEPRERCQRDEEERDLPDAGIAQHAGDHRQHQDGSQDDQPRTAEATDGRTPFARTSPRAWAPKPRAPSRPRLRASCAARPRLSAALRTASESGQRARRRRRPRRP